MGPLIYAQILKPTSSSLRRGGTTLVFVASSPPLFVFIIPQPLLRGWLPKKGERGKTSFGTEVSPFQIDVPSLVEILFPDRIAPKAFGGLGGLTVPSPPSPSSLRSAVGGLRCFSGEPATSIFIIPQTPYLGLATLTLHPNPRSARTSDTRQPLGEIKNKALQEKRNA